MPKKRNNRKGKRGKAGAGAARLSHKQITDARKRKVFQVHRAIEEGALSALAENPNRTFQRCIVLGIEHARNLIKTNKIGLNNITIQHLNIAVQALQEKGQSSPRNIMNRILGLKRAELKTEDEIWKESFRKAGISPRYEKVKPIIRELHPRVVAMIKSGRPYSSDVIGIIVERCQQEHFTYSEAQKVAGFFVEHDHEKNENSFTDFYHRLATGKPRPLIKGKKR